MCRCTLLQRLLGGVVAQRGEMGSPVAPSPVGAIIASCATLIAALAGRDNLSGGQDHTGGPVGAPPTPGRIDQARDSAAGPTHRKGRASRRPERIGGPACGPAVRSENSGIIDLPPKTFRLPERDGRVMLTEQDLVDYMVWSAHAPQSVEELRPKLARGVAWLSEMGLTESPLHRTDQWWSLESARAHDLIDLWLLQARPIRDRAAEHEMRNLLARLGAGVRPYKP